MTDILLRETDNGILRLTLNDPATRNALSERMIASLTSAMKDAGIDHGIRVVVVAAHGPAFSSGHNLREISAHRGDADKGAGYFATLFADCAELMLSIIRCPKPVIAEVQGTASAAGCQLVASCDLAFAADTAEFSTPGVNIGLFCSTPMVALSRNVAMKHAMEMLLTGDAVSARDAERIGLINRAVSPNKLGDAVKEMAAKIASKSLVTVKTGKEAFYRQAEMPLAEAYAYTARVMAENLMRRDAREGIGAFLEKRQPKWADA